eukprot:gb/GFBE01031418.1/.p1 GENE.gb/GFBE01031418.1/~~gb/GFBE01031418.1/.p1  ORF type:complete len:193 (+),score=46.43 gb/GFBE01031418.1/:1-579(+)
MDQLEAVAEEVLHDVGEFPPVKEAIYEVKVAGKLFSSWGRRILDPAITFSGLTFHWGHVLIVLSGVFVMALFVYLLLKTEEVASKQRVVSARHILMRTEADIYAAKARLDAGEKFSMVAKALSLCPSSKADGGNLGVFKPGELNPAFDRICFDPRISPVGEVVGPYKTQFGWHLFRVDYRTGFDDQESKKDA